MSSPNNAASTSALAPLAEECPEGYSGWFGVISNGVHAVSPVVASLPSTSANGIAVIGLEVPHAHIHLIPMNRVSDMNFASPKLSLSKEELQETAEKISKEFI